MDPRVEQLYSRANSLVAEFYRGRGTNYIDEAIALDREALVLCPPGHFKRPAVLTWLANHLWSRYKQLGAMMDLDEAIMLDREALKYRPPGNTDRSESLNNLANDLITRYHQLGEIEDINKAITLAREALMLSPPGHPYLSVSLQLIANGLTDRYKQLGEMGDLNEAIALARDALVLCPLGHPGRSLSLNNLSNHLSTRYNRLGALEDLSEAIVLGRDVWAHCPPGNPGRSMSSSNLATHLSARYKQLGAMEDLNEAIFLARDALEHCPPGHRDQFAYLNNLAVHLSTRYELLRTTEDLNEAIVLDQDALALCPPGHPNRSMTLNNNAARLFTRYNQLGAIEDLNKAIVLNRDALVLRPPGHPDRSMSLNNLAAYLFTRYGHLRAMEDLDEAIDIGRDTIAHRPSGHPDRSFSLDNLAKCVRARFTHSRQLKDKEELFSIYAKLADVSQAVFSSTLSTAREWIRAAEDFQHPSRCLAHETALQSLVHYLATLPSLPQHLSVLKNLTSSLAADAFSALLRDHFPTNAVELLEQGRGVFWSQLNRLRSPLDDVIASGPRGTTLANEFSRLTSLVHNALDSPGVNQHDRVYRLNIELQTVVTHIRELPGLSRFLLPSLFSDLQKAALEGPIIIVNASDYSCDALVVFCDRDPTHIPLSVTKADVREMSSHLHILTMRAKVMNMTRDFARFLRGLWDDVVSPIVDFLLTIQPRHSRIWWCPTAEFSLLPLHAAGPYRKGQQNLADLYISSYTPTLATLIRARRPIPSNSVTEGKHLVAIGQAKGTGESELVSIGTELTIVGQRVEGLATFTRIEGPESCIARVSDAFDTNEWVHLACHGLPNRKQPFESAFTLQDGRFTIERIIQCKLDNAQFAYLSACHTTVGDEDSPDEVIHLASAMQFAGFRSVIGTMWAVDDGKASKIVSMFYENIKDESGRLDHTRAAFALNKTMRTMAGIPFEQRILYVHLGA